MLSKQEVAEHFNQKEGLALSRIRAICADAERRFENSQSMIERVEILQTAVIVSKKIASGEAE